MTNTRVDFREEANPYLLLSVPYCLICAGWHAVVYTWLSGAQNRYRVHR